MLKIGDKVRVNLPKYLHCHGKEGVIGHVDHKCYGAGETIYSVRFDDKFYYGGNFSESTLIKLEDCYMKKIILDMIRSANKSKNNELIMYAKQLIDGFADIQNMPSDIRGIGRELEEEYSTDTWVYDKLELWNYKEDMTWVLVNDKDEFMCTRDNELRTFEWCEENCPRFFSCNTIMNVNDAFVQKYD